MKKNAIFPNIIKVKRRLSEMNDDEGIEGKGRLDVNLYQSNHFQCLNVYQIFELAKKKHYEKYYFPKYSWKKQIKKFF